MITAALCYFVSSGLRGAEAGQKGSIFDAGRAGGVRFGVPPGTLNNLALFLEPKKLNRKVPSRFSKNVNFYPPKIPGDILFLSFFGGVWVMEIIAFILICVVVLFYVYIYFNFIF